MTGSSRAGLRLVGVESLDVPTFFDVENLHYVDGDDTLVVRSVVRHPGAVVVVPVVDGRIVMIRQYRAAVDSDVLELPAGKLDVEGESLADAAARECEEEIGYRPRRMNRLIAFWNSPGFTDERTTAFVGHDLTYVGRDPGGPEEIASEIEEVSLDQIHSMIESGEIEDAKSIIALMTYLRTRQDDNKSSPSPPC